MKKTLDTPFYERLTVKTVDDKKKLSNTAIFTTIALVCVTVALAACIYVLF